MPGVIKRTVRLVCEHCQASTCQLFKVREQVGCLHGTPKTQAERIVIVVYSTATSLVSFVFATLDRSRKLQQALTHVLRRNERDDEATLRSPALEPEEISHYVRACVFWDVPNTQILRSHLPNR